MFHCFLGSILRGKLFVASTFIIIIISYLNSNAHTFCLLASGGGGKLWWRNNYRMYRVDAHAVEEEFESQPKQGKIVFNYRHTHSSITDRHIRTPHLSIADKPISKSWRRGKADWLGWSKTDRYNTILEFQFRLGS